MTGMTTTTTTLLLLRHLALASASSDDYDYYNNGEESTFDPKVFWSVNAFIFFLVASACTWCWCCGGKSFLQRNHPAEMRQQSDLEYARTLRQRQQAAEEAKKDTPEKRRQKLLASFRRCQVNMIVEENDLVECSSSEFKPKLTTRKDLSTTTPSVAALQPSTTAAAAAALPPLTEEDEADDVPQDKSAAASPDSAIVGATTTADEAVVAMEEGDGDGVAAENVDDSAFTVNAPVTMDEEGDAEKENHSDPESTTAEEGDAEEEEEEPVPDPATMAELEEQMEEYGFLVLRRRVMVDISDKKKKSKKEQKKKLVKRTFVEGRVPNCCAICLMSYEVGDTVTWSSNKACPHAFHQECMLGWLVKMQNGTPCPCCRQEFTDLEDYRKERKIRWAAGNAFDPSAIAFR